MIVAVSVVELHIPAACSLKDKRRVVRALMDKIHQRYRVSVAETDFHDLHQRAEFGIAAVHGSQAQAEKLMAGIQALIEQTAEAQLLWWEPEYLEPIR